MQRLLAHDDSAPYVLRGDDRRLAMATIDQLERIKLLLVEHATLRTESSPAPDTGIR
jgi:hypothetical protein